MVKCMECKKELDEIDIFWYNLGTQYKIPYCSECYHKRIKYENEIWKKILAEGHL